MESTTITTTTMEPQFTSPTYYTNLGMKYHAAYSDDPLLRQSIKTFTSFLPRPAHVLECGPGTGIVAETIVESGCRLHGIDMSEGMVNICRSRIPAETATFEVANMLEWEPAAESPDGVHFDGVVASLSIFELSKSQTAHMIRDKWSRWIKPGGYLFIGTCDPEMWGVDPREYDADGCVEGAKAVFLDHVVANTLFTEDGWRKVLGQGRFEVVRTERGSLTPRSGNESEPRLYVFARKEVEEKSKGEGVK